MPYLTLSSAAVPRLTCSSCSVAQLTSSKPGPCASLTSMLSLSSRGELASVHPVTQSRQIGEYRTNLGLDFPCLLATKIAGVHHGGYRGITSPLTIRDLIAAVIEGFVSRRKIDSLAGQHIRP